MLHIWNYFSKTMQIKSCPCYCQVKIFAFTGSLSPALLWWYLYRIQICFFASMSLTASVSMVLMVAGSKPS